MKKKGQYYEGIVEERQIVRIIRALIGQDYFWSH